MFIGRKYEMESLNKEYEKGQFALSVIYGRRRVGKTFLIQHFLKDKKGAYFVATESNENINLELISKSIYVACGYPEGLPRFESFEQAFEFLFQGSLKNRIVFVIDEYSYLALSSEYISSLIQRLIDKYKNTSKLFLILCGSSMSFMENQVLGVKSPLYGRRTSQYKISSFDYFDSAKFVSRYSNKEAAIVYAITGGVAEYLTFFDDNATLKENIIKIYLSPNGRLFDEPSNLLNQEMRDPRTYNDIIYSIAQGATKLNEIATKTSITSSGLNYYINSLIELEIIEKKVPVGEKNFKRPIYSIKDYMFRFWFTFVQPNISLININLGLKVFEEIISDKLNEYMGHIFEDISIQYFKRILKNLDFLPKYYGNWWGTNNVEKTQIEIDWIAVSDKKTIFSECKWRNEKIDVNVLNALRIKSQFYKYNVSEYWVFSLSGFTFKATKDVRLISLEDIYNLNE